MNPRAIGYELAHMILQSASNKESQELRYLWMKRTKESDVHVTTSDLQKATDNLENGRSHLEALQDAYDKLEIHSIRSIK
ncbi:unnamed protein product [Onchocerca flexuosa]|uniref:Rx_N domain-containing protein n=1 Tax=Onchocerca flexuosa TaxID=387005 RepID=A0A183H204_9BILA|nr:unnamed protein product [Onchocerca flexuosa]